MVLLSGKFGSENSGALVEVGDGEGVEVMVGVWVWVGGRGVRLGWRVAVAEGVTGVVAVAVTGKRMINF